MDEPLFLSLRILQIYGPESVVYFCVYVGLSYKGVSIVLD